jgi:hypothetical protein
MFTTGGWDPDSLALMTCNPHRGHATSSGQPQVARRVVERKVQGDGGGRWQLRFAHMGRAHPATGHAPASGMHSPLQPTHRPCMVLGSQGVGAGTQPHQCAQAALQMQGNEVAASGKKTKPKLYTTVLQTPTQRHPTTNPPSNPTPPHLGTSHPDTCSGTMHQAQVVTRTRARGAGKEQGKGPPKPVQTGDGDVTLGVDQEHSRDLAGHNNQPQPAWRIQQHDGAPVPPARPVSRGPKQAHTKQTNKKR